MKEIVIRHNESNQRIDRFLKKYLPNASKGFIYKMLRKKRIKLNGNRAKAEYMIKEGDTLQLFLAEDTINKFKNQIEVKNIEWNLKVVYEDNNIILINKDKGLLSHSTGDSKEDTVVEQLVAYLYNSDQYDPSKEKTFKPSICNRLDRNTSGLVIGAKNFNALQSVNEIIREGMLKKYYLCIVRGRVNGKKELKGYLLKDNDSNKVQIASKKTEDGKEIHTVLNVIKSSEDYSLLEIDLITGRTHQIRAHLSSIGHPIIGDYKYGDERINDYFKKEYDLYSQFLHAYRIKFNGFSDELKYLNGMIFTAELDDKFKFIMKKIIG